MGLCMTSHLPPSSVDSIVNGFAATGDALPQLQANDQIDSQPIDTLKSVQDLLKNELSSQPLVSVVIPTYNREKVVLTAVDSALNQSYRNLEVIVIDDGSTDNTREALAKYGDRIRYYYQSNQGVSAARNHAINVANGKYIAFLDSDDEWFPNKIEKQIEYLEANPDLSFVACLSMKEKRTYSGYEDHAGQFLRFIREPFTQNMTRYVARRECFQQFGLFDTKMQGPEDWEMWLRLLKNGCRFGYVPEVLMTYAASDDSISSRPYAMLAGEEIIHARYISTLPSFWQRLRLGAAFNARSYMNASICFREEGELWKSLRFMLASVLISPMGPRNNLRIPVLMVLPRMMLAKLFGR